MFRLRTRPTLESDGESDTSVRVGLLVVPLVVHLAPGVDPVEVGGRRARDLLFVVRKGGRMNIETWTPGAT